MDESKYERALKDFLTALGFLRLALERLSILLSELETSVTLLETANKIEREQQDENDDIPARRSQQAVVREAATNRPPTLCVTLLLNNAQKPIVAYRIMFEDSWTIYSKGGLTSAWYPADCGSDRAFVTAVQAHIDWYSGIRSPFISLFIDLEHARRWANLRIGKRGREWFKLLTVAVKPLPWVYSLATLVDKLGIATELKREQYDKELLLMGKIPAEAVVGSQTFRIQRPAVDDLANQFAKTSIGSS